MSPCKETLHRMTDCVKFLPLDHKKRIFYRHVTFFRFWLAHAQKAGSDAPPTSSMYEVIVIQEKNKNEVFLQFQMMKTWITHKAPTPKINMASVNEPDVCWQTWSWHLCKISCHGDDCAIVDDLYGTLQESAVQRVVLWSLLTEWVNI